MYICIIDDFGKIQFHKNLDSSPENLSSALEPYLPNIVIGVECVFTWYWISDYCCDHGIPFVLGHALYMKSIHGGKTKNDKIDSSKIATLLRGGMFPLAYVYPRKMRAARDLLRRRQYFVHHQSEFLTHIKNTNSQYNLIPFTKQLQHPGNRKNLHDAFPDDPCLQLSILSDMQLLDFYHKILNQIELNIKKQAVHHDPYSLQLLKTIPGVGPILALVILYEIHDIARFETVGNFISYSRLVKCSHESAGKRLKSGHNKIGNSHLKWAFSEAAIGSLRNNPAAKKMQQRLINRYGRAKAISLIAQKLGRCAYFMLKRKEPFDAIKFYG
jgi:transposase